MCLVPSAVARSSPPAVAARRPSPRPRPRPQRTRAYLLTSDEEAFIKEFIAEIEKEDKKAAQ